MGLASKFEDLRQGHARLALDVRIELHKRSTGFLGQPASHGGLSSTPQANQSHLLVLAMTDSPKQNGQWQTKGPAHIREADHADVALPFLKLDQKPRGHGRTRSQVSLGEPGFQPTGPDAAADDVQHAVHLCTIMHKQSLAKGILMHYSAFNGGHHG